jgi:hypothetical protein
MYGLRLGCQHGNLDLRHMIWFWLFSTRVAVFTIKGRTSEPDALSRGSHLRLQVLSIVGANADGGSWVHLPHTIVVSLARKCHDR